MTRFGPIREGVTDLTLINLELVIEGIWSGLGSWFCEFCSQARPFRANPRGATPDNEILRHFAQVHPDELLKHGLTEQPKPVRVRSSLVDEYGKAMFFEREG